VRAPPVDFRLRRARGLSYQEPAWIERCSATDRLCH
jgi:hypothetical protein